MNNCFFFIYHQEIHSGSGILNIQFDKNEIKTTMKIIDSSINKFHLNFNENNLFYQIKLNFSFGIGLSLIHSYDDRNEELIYLFLKSFSFHYRTDIQNENKRFFIQTQQIHVRLKKKNVFFLLLKEKKLF